MFTKHTHTTDKGVVVLETSHETEVQVQCCSALRGSLYATLDSVVTVSLLVISVGL